MVTTAINPRLYYLFVNYSLDKKKLFPLIETQVLGNHTILRKQKSRRDLDPLRDVYYALKNYPLASSSNSC